jgi:hypothetical protein
MFARNKNKEVAYVIDHLWNDFEILLKKYDETYPQNEEERHKTDKAEDDVAFEKCYATMKHLYEMGRQVEKLHFVREIKAKAELGFKVRKILPDAFGEELIPPIKGQRSAVYVREVYQPFMEKSSHIKHQKWLKLICAMVHVHLDQEAEQAKQVAKQCKLLVAEILDPPSPRLNEQPGVLQFSKFAAPAITPDASQNDASNVKGLTK